VTDRPGPEASKTTSPIEGAAAEAEGSRVPSSKELPAPPVPTKADRLPIPTTWWVAILVVAAILGAVLWSLVRYGTGSEIEAVVAWSNTMIAIAALFSIYLSSRGRGGRQE
jgi:hypothetical protein